MIGRRPALLLLLPLLLGASPAPSFSQEPAEPAPTPTPAVGVAEPLAVLPGREGYAFDNPRILVQQRLLGVAHGVSLLVSACMDVPAHIDATLAAYVPWREGQEQAIAAAQADLSRHYFGARAADARWPDLLRVLNLKNRLELAPGSPELAAACETLPAALGRPRYGLGRQFQLMALLTEATAAIETSLRHDWCHRHLEGDARTLLDLRYEIWSEINGPRQAQATAALKSDWPVEAPAESFAQWEQILRGAAMLRGGTEECLAFSESLKRPQAALRYRFAPPEVQP